MDCNNVHYHHPTIRLPARFCEDAYISSDCHPDDEWKSIDLNETNYISLIKISQIRMSIWLRNNNLFKTINLDLN